MTLHVNSSLLSLWLTVYKTLLTYPTLHARTPYNTTYFTGINRPSHLTSSTLKTQTMSHFTLPNILLLRHAETRLNLTSTALKIPRGT